ncbi:MAG: hypothetical protein WC670_09675 [Pseudolabrys sp.]|jgi:hypothetical protein
MNRRSFAFGLGACIVERSVINASAADPYVINEFNQYVGFRDTRGRTQVLSVVDPSTTKVVVIDGQSLLATANGTTTYPPTGHVDNLNIYDGGIYDGADPVLGASYNGYTSPVLRIGDRIIANGKASRVIVIPIAMGGSLWAAYRPDAVNSCFTRGKTALLRCRALGFEPDAWYVGRGESDAVAGTSAIDLRNSGWAFADGLRALGYSGPMYIGIHSIQGNIASPTIQSGLAMMVDAARDIRAGINCDTLCGPSDRIDGTHLTNGGCDKYGYAVADLMFP